MTNHNFTVVNDAKRVNRKNLSVYRSVLTSDAVIETTKHLEINNGATLNGGTTINDSAVVNGGSTLNGGTTINDSALVNGGATLNGGVTINNNLNVNSDTFQVRGIQLGFYGHGTVNRPNVDFSGTTDENLTRLRDAIVRLGLITST